MAETVLHRVVRRETHSPRSAATIVVLLLVVAAVAFVGVEIVLHLLGSGPLLLEPASGLDWLRELPQQQPQALVVAGAAGLGLIGLVLVSLGVAPGRRAKHQLSSNASQAVVVDNGVLASALAERVRHESNLARGDVRVGVGHRTVDVQLRSIPGQGLEEDAVCGVVEEELARYGITPPLHVRVRQMRLRAQREE